MTIALAPALPYLAGLAGKAAEEGAKKLLEAEPELAQEVERLLGGAGALHLYQARVEGSGAVAQGPGAVAAGAGGVAIGDPVGKGSVARGGGTGR